MRRFLAALAVVVATAVLAGFAPPASAAPVTYAEPVSGRVVDPFRPPKAPYGPGNRGLEYSTVAGSGARASAPGRVTFAGNVGGTRHVVVQHADGVRTSYAFLRTVDVRVGQTVRQSEAVGTTGRSFHFGARIGDAYVDPAVLLASGPARVHLIPDGEFSEQGASNDRWALFSIVNDTLGAVSQGAFDWVGARVRDVAVVADALASGAIDLVQLAAGTASAAMRQLAAHLVTILDEIVNLGQLAGPLASLAAALADILQAFLEPCTPAEQPVPPMAGSHDRIAVFVAGLGSHSDGRNDPSNLSRSFHAVDKLGYAAGNVYDFSYRGGRNPQPYEPKDTTDNIRNRARDLRALLDQIGRDHPGASVDLIAHSQGGLITREALAHDYDDAEHVLPPVGHVVTLGTPHHGADAATANAWLRWSAHGQAIRALAEQYHTSFDLTGPGVAQLAETSDFIRDLNARSLREGVAYTSIGAAADSIAPAVRTRLKGASNVLVDSGNFMTSHSGLHHSDAARRELQLALADAPPTCRRLDETAARAFTSVAIAEFEDTVGRVAAAGPRP